MITVHYTSTRGEIWRWYWRAWSRPNGLWRFHVLVGVLVAVAATVRPGAASFEPRHFVEIAVIATLCCVVLLPLWPQIQYKPSQRKLTIDSEGWSTTVGKLSGKVPWTRVRTVEEAEGAVVIVGTNRNALIVPARAFASTSERNAFLTAARTWHAAAAA